MDKNEVKYTHNKIMSTPCGIQIFNEKNKLLVTVYAHYDGGFNAMGNRLKEFLSNFDIVNGIKSDDNVRCANGMGCLAAQVIAHLKTGIGDIYIATSEIALEYTYYIHYSDSKVALTGITDTEILEYKLYDDYLKYAFTADFTYESESGVKDRHIGILEMNSKYIKGMDLNDGAKYKAFSINKIVGGMENVKIISKFS